ncbi:hypothetical protein AOLI_G00299340 [Acnodon oligacanthus]
MPRKLIYFPERHHLQVRREHAELEPGASPPGGEAFQPSSSSSQEQEQKPTEKRLMESLGDRPSTAGPPLGLLALSWAEERSA